MKKIEAIIKPFRLDSVKEGLVALGTRGSARPGGSKPPRHVGILAREHKRMET